MPHAHSQGYGGLEYLPSLGTHLARQKKLAELHGTYPHSHSLPAGFPERCQSDMVWDGTDMAEGEGIIMLTEFHVEEIDHALHFFQGQSAYVAPSLHISNHRCLVLGALRFVDPALLRRFLYDQ